MRSILKLILKFLARRIISRYHPIVIGVTGSVGKTTAKEAIYRVLKKRFYVRKNEENFNNEFGVPYAVLGINAKHIFSFNSAVKRKRLIAWGIVKAFWLGFGWPRQDYPKVLDLELAASRPGDIQHLVSIVRPTIGVLTAIGQVPVHLEFYKSPKHLAQEKAKLIQSLLPDPSTTLEIEKERRMLPRRSLAVLNYDDQAVVEMKNLSRAKTVTFSFSPQADLWASEISYFTGVEGKVGGLAFKINQGASFVPMRLNNIIAKHQIYGVLAATVVALHLGMNLVDVSMALEDFVPPKGRMNLLRGIKNSIIIDDTYNASPASTEAALESLTEFGGRVITNQGRGRKLAMLGDMLELGESSVAAHEKIGVLVPKHADLIFFVGDKMKLAAATAREAMPHDSIFEFPDSVMAAIAVQAAIREGDVIFVKGSQGIRLEKVVAEIMAEPERKSELLARQYGEWLNC